MLVEVEAQAHCANCHRRVEHDWIICPNCRNRLRRVCPNCSKLVELDWSLCAWCGKDFERPELLRDTTTTRIPVRSRTIAAATVDDATVAAPVEPKRRGPSPIEPGPDATGPAGDAALPKPAPPGRPSPAARGLRGASTGLPAASIWSLAADRHRLATLIIAVSSRLLAPGSGDGGLAAISGWPRPALPGRRARVARTGLSWPSRCPAFATAAVLSGSAAVAGHRRVARSCAAGLASRWACSWSRRVTSSSSSSSSGPPRTWVQAGGGTGARQRLLSDAVFRLDRDRTRIGACSWSRHPAAI